MECYQKRKRILAEHYGKLIQVILFNDEVLQKGNNEQYVKQIAGITDEEGLDLAYEAKDGIHQHYNILFIAGAKDPIAIVDDLKSLFDDI